MTIRDIINSITKKLSDRYSHTIYIDKVEQNMKLPCFFVTCLNSEQNKVGYNRYKRDYLFNIRYHPKSLKRVESLIIGEELQELLSDFGEIKYEIVDDVLQVTLSLSKRFKEKLDFTAMQNTEIEGGIK